MDRQTIIKQLHAAGAAGVVDQLVSAKSADARAKILTDHNIELAGGQDFETVWSKAVTISIPTANVEDVTVIDDGAAMDGESADKMDGEYEDEGEGEKSASVGGRLGARINGASIRDYVGATLGARGTLGAPAITSRRALQAKAYTAKARAGAVNPHTRKAYVFSDGEQAELAGAWLRLVAFGGRPELGAEYTQKRADVEVIKAHGTNLPFLGSAFVPDEFSAELIENLSTAGAYQRAVGVQRMSRDVLRFPRITDDGEFAEVGENAETSSSNKPESDTVQLTAVKSTFLTRVSRELLNDSQISVADVLARMIERARGLYVDKKGITGAIGGAGLQQLVGSSNSTYDAALAASWADYTSAKLQAWFGLLGDRGNPNEVPSIICSRQFYHSVLENVALSAGGASPLDYIRGISGDLGGADAQYNGFPVYFTSLMPKTYTADQTDAYVGFFQSAAKMGEVNSLEIRQSSDRYFEYDQEAFLAVQRVAVNNHDVNDESDPLVVALQA